MAVVGIGQSLVLMQGFARQKAVARNPKKKARTFAFRRYTPPSETKRSLPAKLAFGKAAHGAYGKSYEEVIAAIQSACSGRNYGGKAHAAKMRVARHKAAAANISRMRARLVRM